MLEVKETIKLVWHLFTVGTICVLYDPFLTASYFLLLLYKHGILGDFNARIREKGGNDEERWNIKRKSKDKIVKIAEIDYL